MKITLKIDGRDETFVAPFLSGRLYKDFFEMEKMLHGPITPDVMDVLIDFVCRVYGNQFTIEQYWDGVALNKVLSLIVKTISELGEMIMEDMKDTEGGSDNTQ